MTQGMTNNCAAYKPWLHAVSLLLALATMPLVLSGGLVTSTGSGMADPDWNFTPFRLLTPEGWAEVATQIALLIEHSHRQIGYLVGIIAMGFAILTMASLQGPRRWLGPAVLLAVCLQGALGAFRIKLHAWFGPQFAMIHGITGQLTFTCMVLVSMLLSRGWLEAVPMESLHANKIRRLAFLTAFVTIGQLVAGAALRHMGGHLLLGIHMLLALAVLVHVILVWARTIDQPSGYLARPALAALILVALQWLLGLGAWMVGGGTLALEASQLTKPRIALTTAHQFMGAVILATVCVVWFRAWQVLPRGQVATQTQRQSMEVSA